MSYICPDCERTMTELEKLGKVKYVQGYAQCADCGGDLDDKSVVMRTKNEESALFECEDCHLEFAWCLIFAGSKPSACPRCSRRNISRKKLSREEHLMVECDECGRRKAVKPRIWRNSLWTPREECECGHRMFPMKVMVGELIISEEMEHNADIQM